MIVPRPRSLVWREGVFTLGPGTAVRAPGELAAMVRRELGPATGFPLAAGDGAASVIALDLDPGLGAEEYRLSVTTDAIEVRAGSSAGAFYAVQTVRQLLPPAIYAWAPVQGRVWTVPCVEVDDAPRFRWRGGHIDVGRHFMPKDFLFRFVDLLALHKYNVLHLHLTEDQGWRFESERYPRLVEIGAWRRETRGDGTPHGGYYRQSDLRELVAYAEMRFVTVVPEIDLPGHTQAAIAAYPELGNHPERPIEVATTWGIKEDVLNVEDSTLEFCKAVLTEVMDVFPSRFIHIGGDECPTTQWQQSARALERVRELGLRGVEDLQPWFTRQLGAFLAEHGRKLVGWDEIIERGAVPEATVMAWRNQDMGVEAAALGHEVVMGPQQATYFDHYASNDPDEPRALGGFSPLEHVYAFEPVSEEMSEEEAGRVLGTQFQVWTEWLPGTREVEYMAFPRASALSEVAWTSGPRDFADFEQRLHGHLERLDVLGVNYRPLAGSHPWQRGGTGRRRREPPAARND